MNNPVEFNDRTSILRLAAESSTTNTVGIQDWAALVAVVTVVGAFFLLLALVLFLVVTYWFVTDGCGLRWLKGVGMGVPRPGVSCKSSSSRERGPSLLPLLPELMTDTSHARVEQQEH